MRRAVPRLNFPIAWHWLVLAAQFLFIVTSPLAAQTYNSPTNPRTDINLNPGWRFIRQDVAGAQNSGFDDSAWTTLDLPHTWNNLDGQDGGNDYYQGIGWYRRHYSVDASQTNRHFFLKFDGANLVSDVYVNGNFVGEHQGGFAAFVYDVTTNLSVGADNVIAVKVNNASNTNIPPLSGDFTMFGGIYRDAHLLVTDSLHISPLDYGSPGVYLKTTNATAGSADLQVTALVSNSNPTSVSVTVRTTITDANTNIVVTLTNVFAQFANSLSNVVANTVIANPHLWKGLADPYLYRAFVEIYNGTNLVDLVSQPLGFRSLRFDPTNGLFLNGQYYDLHGVCLHQDFFNLGWALTDAQRATNFALLKELGATAVRLAHYQHAEHTYQLGDQSGIALWTEIPLVNSVNSSAAFLANAQQQLRELVRQNFNHPSIITWSVFNEITLGSGPSPDSVVSNLAQLAAQEDSTRPSTGATLASPTGNNSSWMPKLSGFNEYYGWYETPTEGINAWADNLHAARPTNCLAVTEYGAGASIFQHSEDPVAKPGQTGAPFHPEEWQNIVHEINWAGMKTRPFIWGKFLWNMFDFAVDSRNEGGTAGRNDKGIVTYDRLTRKDAFYFYKANWTTNPMVYITGHTFTNRLTNSITAKVYANCDSVQLFVNGTSQGTRTSSSNIFTWPVSLTMGSNFVQAVGTKGSSNVTDSLVWIAPIPPPIISLITPVGGIAALNNTNASLKLSVAISNPVPAVPITTTWSQSAGPAPVIFANSNAPTTTVSFSSNGIYGLLFTASNGATTNLGVVVLVNADRQITNGLATWWKMDETGGTTATDSSGNARTATIVNGTFTSGTFSNAIQFTTATSRATYTAQQSNQITVSAWVRCDTTGGGTFPRIVDTPSCRFMFRFSSSDVNSVGFATYDNVNGDFDSGAGTISLGVWYHVAVSFDRSNLGNRPTFYVNGIKTTTTTLASPSGTAPALSGTGYIGNSSANTRAWNGLIDDLRIYDRVLSDTEIQILASAAPANIAPLVSAGANQIVAWPANVALTGTASDDGKPTPPATLTTTWTQVSGLGTTSFGNSNSPITAATFSAPGNYVLQLTANDGQVQIVSSATIIATTRPVISLGLLPGGVQLFWPTNDIAWRLQSQTNAPNAGLGTNWTDVVNATNRMILPLNLTNGSVFLRLISP